MIQETRFYNVEDDVGLMHSAHHVIGCHIAQEMRVQNASDDVASTIHGLMKGAHHVIGHYSSQETRDQMRLMTWRALSISPCRHRPPRGTPVHHV